MTRHAFTSAQADGPDPTDIQPSHWNAALVTPVVTVSGTTHTVAADDAGKLLRCTSGSATTVTVNDGVLSVGDDVTVLQAGAGTVTVAAGGTATLVSRGSVFDTAGQWAVATVYCDAADHFVLSGDIA